MIRRAIPWIGFALAAATVAVGLALDRSGVVLGTPNPPFLGEASLRVHPLAAVAVAVLAGSVWVAPRLLGVRPVFFAAAALALSLGSRLAVGASRWGVEGWYRVFADHWEAKNEYLPALPALQWGPGFLLDRFAELVPSLPVHAAGHPPGLLLLLDATGATTAERMAALCIGSGALAVPLTYLTARHLLDERGARWATLLVALSPIVLLFGVTSPDAVYLTAGLLIAWPLAAGRLFLGAGATAAASFLAWSLPAVAAWGALLALARGRRREAVVLSLAVGVALVAWHGAAWALFGFDALGTLEATESVYRVGVASIRPYEFWVFGSPVIFLLFLGVPVFWLALRALGDREPLAVAFFAVLAIAAVGGFTKAETERIWLFLAPLGCLAAATRLAPGRLRLVLGALAVQALGSELLLDTVW